MRSNFNGLQNKHLIFCNNEKLKQNYVDITVMVYDMKTRAPMSKIVENFQTIA